MIGRQVGDYRIVRQLGEGGMGMVYEGQHVALGQKVAVKSLHSSLMGNQAAKDRFMREAQALARLNHPNIISLLNFYNDANGCILIMEFADGEDLEAKLQKMGLIPPQQCIPWFIGACRGLSYAHQQGIIHRDIKPSNIIVHPSGATKLLDFGTAKVVDAQRLTQQGMTLGTVIYMSKEQLLGKPLDARSDVYSLGVTLYECVTGHLPFYDEEERKLVVKIAKEEPIRPSQHYPGISPELEGIILKAMAKEPAQRFQSATEMAEALEAILGGGASAPRPQTGPAPAPAPAPTPTPATPTPAGAAPGGGGSVLFNPLFLVGAVLCILGLGGGILAILGEGTLRLVGAVSFGVLELGGVLLAVVAIVTTKKAAGGGAASGSVPASVGTASSATGNCPRCGRALLAGMPDCPFCNPQAAAAPAPTPQPMPFDPGGTMNVNSAQAAQQYAPPPAYPAAVAAPGVAVLQVIDGNDKGRQFQITSAAKFTIGRAPACGLTLNDPGVSGNHAALHFENGALVVEDTGSRNGVFLNNQKIHKHPLKSGDLIVIGSTRMMVTL